MRCSSSERIRLSDSWFFHWLLFPHDTTVQVNRDFQSFQRDFLIFNWKNITSRESDKLHWFSPIVLTQVYIFISTIFILYEFKNIHEIVFFYSQLSAQLNILSSQFITRSYQWNIPVSLFHGTGLATMFSWILLLADRLQFIDQVHTDNAESISVFLPSTVTQG